MTDEQRDIITRMRPLVVARVNSHTMSLSLDPDFEVLLYLDSALRGDDPIASDEEHVQILIEIARDDYGVV